MIAAGISVENDRVHLPVNGPKLLVSNAYSTYGQHACPLLGVASHPTPINRGVLTWAWKMSGNSSFEFGVIADLDRLDPESLHTRGQTVSAPPLSTSPLPPS